MASVVPRSTLAGWRGAAARPPPATPAGPPLPVRRPGDQSGPYRIVGLLGSGGMADVFTAEHPLLPRPVALKVARCHDDRSASFARLALEADILSSLRHPAVSRIYDRG